MSPKLSRMAHDADRRVVRSTVLSCIVAAAALATAALAFAALDHDAQAIAAVPASAVQGGEPISSVPSAAEALANVPWRPEPEVVTSGG